MLGCLALGGGRRRVRCLAVGPDTAVRSVSRVLSRLPFFLLVLDLGYSYSDILSWAAEPLVSVLHGNASLTMQRLSEQRFRTTPGRDLVEHTHSPRWWYHQWRWLQSLVLRVIDSQKHLRAGLADRPTWQSG
jgi:hypothetical protein